MKKSKKNPASSLKLCSVKKVALQNDKNSKSSKEESPAAPERKFIKRVKYNSEV